jgi:DNA uptake protein ComE-like DNA-binding protein
MSDRNPARVGLSYVWALVPLLTVGFATPLVFFFAAARLRSGRVWAACASYIAVLVIEQATAASHFGVVASVALGILTLGAVVHALIIREAVFFGRAKPSAMEVAVDAAQDRRRLRERARRLAASDPALALELGVGRPDLRRDYDDGGVVDVNHAPVGVLATPPGVTPERAERIVRMRTERGGFVSADELCVFAELPPEVTAQISERTVYLPGGEPTA